MMNGRIRPEGKNDSMFSTFRANGFYLSRKSLVVDPKGSILAYHASFNFIVEAYKRSPCF